MRTFQRLYDTKISYDLKKNTFIYISSRKFHYFFKQQDPANWDLWVDGLSHDAFYCGGSFRYQMAIIHTCVFLFFFLFQNLYFLK